MIRKCVLFFLLWVGVVVEGVDEMDWMMACRGQLCASTLMPLSAVGT